MHKFIGELAVGEVDVVEATYVVDVVDGKLQRVFAVSEVDISEVKFAHRNHLPSLCNIRCLYVYVLSIGLTLRGYNKKKLLKGFQKPV